MSEKVNDILAEISKTRSTLKVFTPSTKKNTEIKPLTLAQQKLIIEITTDNTLSVLFFNNTFYKILKDNVTGDVGALNTIDRVPLTLALRKKLKEEIEFDDDTVVNVNDLLMNAKAIPYDIESKAIDSEEYIFEVEIPTLALDNQVNTLLLNKYRSSTIDDNKLKNLISDLYSYEILKFIKKLKINDKEIDLHDDIREGIKIIETIDSDRFIKVTDYINTVRDKEVLFSTCPKTGNKIDIVPDLFIL